MSSYSSWVSLFVSSVELNNSSGFSGSFIPCLCLIRGYSVNRKVSLVLPLKKVPSWSVLRLPMWLPSVLSSMQGCLADGGDLG